MSMIIIARESPRATAWPWSTIISIVTPSVEGSPCSTMPTLSPTSTKSQCASIIRAIGVV